LAEKERKHINKGKTKIKPSTKPLQNDPIEDIDISNKPEIQMRI